MPAAHCSDEQNPRLPTSVAGDESSLNQLRAAHDRRARQQHRVEQLAQLLVGVSDAKYSADSREMLLHAAAEALCDGLGADSVYMLEGVSGDVAFRVCAGAGQSIDAILRHNAHTPAHLGAHAATAAGWALRSNQVVRVEDYARENRFQREDWPGQKDVRSEIGRASCRERG